MSWSFDNGAILMRSALLGDQENNVFVVACADTGKGVIVDAACETDAVLELADGVDVRAILTTHGHWDHVRSVEDVAAALEIPFLLHPLDYDLAAQTTPTSPTPLADGQVIEIGETNLPDDAHARPHPGLCVLSQPGRPDLGRHALPGWAGDV